MQSRGDITRAVRAVAEGRSVIDPRVVEVLLTSKQARRSSDFDSLTAREKEILGLVAEGWSNFGISEQLGISTRAVERHVQSVFSKLGLTNALQNRRVRAALLYLAEPAR